MLKASKDGVVYLVEVHQDWIKLVAWHIAGRMGMDRFYEILREEMEKEILSDKVPNTITKFDRAFAIAVAKYAEEKGISLM